MKTATLMNRATEREKGKEERKERNQSNTRARSGNYSVNSSCFIGILNTLKEECMAGE